MIVIILYINNLYINMFIPTHHQYMSVTVSLVNNTATIGAKAISKLHYIPEEITDQANLLTFNQTLGD